MYPTPPPPPDTPPKTKASRFAWFPLMCATSGLAIGAATGGLAWLAAPVGLALAGGSGWWLLGKHKRELAELQEQRFEALALRAFRGHQGPTMTKEQLVRDHRLHPEEADEVLNWLVTHDLLTANWDDYDGPLVYERSDAAAGLPLQETSVKPPKRSKGRGSQVIVHHHHAPPHRAAVTEYKNPGVAMALSFFWPGVGQMYAGNISRGLGWMFGTWVGYAMLLVPGVVLHIMNVINARDTADEVNRFVAQHGYFPHGGVPPNLPPPPRPPGT